MSLRSAISSTVSPPTAPSVRFLTCSSPSISSCLSSGVSSSSCLLQVLRPKKTRWKRWSWLGCQADGDGVNVPSATLSWTLSHSSCSFRLQAKTESCSAHWNRFLAVPATVIVEALVNVPKFVSQDRIQQRTLQSVMKCDADTRKNLYANVVLSCSTSGEIVRDVTVFFATTLYFTTQSSNRPRNLSYELPDGTSSLSAPNVSTPMKSIRFPRLRDFNLSCSKRRYQVQEQSAAWYAACATAFSNKPSHQTLGSVLRNSYLTPCVTLSWLGVVGLKRTWRSCLMVCCSCSSGIQHHAWFDSGYVFLRQSHDVFGMNLTHCLRKGGTPDPEVDSCMLWRLYHQATSSRVLHFHSPQTPLTTLRCTKSWPSSSSL